MALSRCTQGLVALALPAGALLLAMPGLSGSAWAGGCHNTHAHPGSVAPRKAEHSVICLINQRRHDYGRSALNAKPKLATSAGRHTAHMRRHHCFSHQCSGEPSLESRLRSVDYLVSGMLSWSYGENIAWGKHTLATPAEIVRAWMHSAAHRANILYGGFRDVGVGVLWGTPQKKNAAGGIYTIDFGYRRLG